MTSEPGRKIGRPFKSPHLKYTSVKVALLPADLARLQQDATDAQPPDDSVSAQVRHAVSEHFRRADKRAGRDVSGQQEGAAR